KYKHYAPRAQVYLLRGDKRKIADFLMEKSKLENVGILCFDEIAKELDGKYVVGFGNENDGAAHAKILFSALRFFDTTDVNEIYATAVGTGGIDLATYNRMLKASGYTIIDL
ncbi:MAG: translation factor SUA5, partial [Clostridiales bacterium]|nr:translation factor SUA5 [Clostridiales bacterium]